MQIKDPDPSVWSGEGKQTVTHGSQPGADKVMQHSAYIDDPMWTTKASSRTKLSSWWLALPSTDSGSATAASHMSEAQETPTFPCC